MFGDSGYRRVMAMLPIAVAGRGAPPIVSGSCGRAVVALGLLFFVITGCRLLLIKRERFVVICEWMTSR